MCHSFFGWLSSIGACLGVGGGRFRKLSFDSLFSGGKHWTLHH
jgi:hypothetical protein